MATFRIVIQTDVTSAVRGTRQVEQELDSVGRAANRLREIIRQTFVFAGIGFGVKELIQLTDTYTKLENRIKLVTNSSKELSFISSQLFDISQRTRTSFDATVTLFTRTAAATKALGITQGELLNVIESVNQAVAISGATSIESTNALIQFSQGLSSARLGGEELRSVLEQLPAIADVIAKSLGVARGELRDLAARGVLTPKVIIKAFQEARGELAGKFSQTTVTLGQSFQRLHDQVLLLVGTFNSTTGASAALANGIIFLADNLKTLLDIVLTLTIAYVSRFIPALLSSTAVMFGNVGAFISLAAGVRTYTGAVALASAATTGWVGVLGLLKLAFLSIPVLAFAFVLTRLITGTGEAAQAQTRYNQSISDFQISMGDLVNASGKAREKLIEDSKAKIEQHVKELESLNLLIEGYLTMGALTVGVREGFGRIGIGTAPSDVIAKSDALRETINRMRSILDEATNPKKPVTPTGLGGSGKLETFDAIIQKLRDENVALGLNAQERELVNKQIDLEYKLKRPLTAVEQELYQALLLENQLLRDKSGLLDQLREPQENYIRGLAAINSLLAEGSITQEEYNTELRRLSIESLAAGRDLESGIQRGLLTIQEQFGDVASIAEDTLVGAFQKAEDALVEFVNTGKLNFKDLVRSILADLTRLSIRQNITAPLANALGIGGITGSTGGGFGGLLSSGLGSLFANSNSFRPSPSFIGPMQPSFGGLFGGLGNLLGFATGGSFEVGGSGGTDSQLVQFRATPGEMVNIATPSQVSNDNRRSSNQRMPATNVTFNITTPNPDGFRMSESQMAAQAARVIGKARRNN